MKTLRYSLAVIILSIATLTMTSQEKYLHLYKNGTVDKSYKVSSIDSALFNESGSEMYLDLYRNGIKHRASNVAKTDSFKIGGELAPSGVYMGIIGFNQALYTKAVGSLSSSTKNDYSSFVSNLTSSNGTLLYYAVDNALTAIETAELPEDLVNVSVVTFTDGLDQGSIMMNSAYTTNEAYLSAVESRIKNGVVNGVPVTAYSIGLRGNDVTDVLQFQKNLKSLASSDDNAIEVSSISEVSAKFDQIANEVYNESFSSTVSLTIPGQSDGTLIRFTFDDVNNASNSTMYIEGTFRLSDRSLTDVSYHGLSCTGGSEVKGVQSGIYVTFTFEDVKSLTTTSVNSSYIDQWSYISNSGKWQINSEFTPDNNTVMEVSRKSALVMLVLDCSSSLGSQFSTVKTQANNFISKLAGYGNDEKFSYIDIDVLDIFAEVDDEFVKVDGGTFVMGATSEQGSDAYSDESPTHSVTLSDFYIGKYEVTQELWTAVMGSNPSKFTGTNLLVEMVSWNDCQTFITKLNELTGKTFRLPTEAEWEYAARGGNKSQGYKYSGSNSIDDVAWYTSNSSSKTHEVGTKQPNELGIYDMSGNVWEWCSDWYGSYSSSSQTNPTGPTSGSNRVLRGGGWDINAGHCRVSYRDDSNPSYRNGNFGFRLVLVP